MRFYSYVLLGTLITFSIHCFTTSEISETDSNTETGYYSEPYRPQFHFSPKSNWMNDPNGMVHYKGEYHLFYQYFPHGNKWGPMHWGHAISTDLVHWEHLPIALFPDQKGLIFSGSAVIDWNNTSGFGMAGEPPMVAIFTYHDTGKAQSGADDIETQAIAYSNDKGRTWIKYQGNPVVHNPGIRDFRDPKVIWYEPEKKWVMALAVLDHLKIYGSPDLIKWELLSEFGKDKGSHDGVWECPDLFPITDDKGNERWVLIQNMNPGNPNGGSGTQYFIGHFDGTKFTVDPGFDKLLKHIPPKIPDGEVFEDFENGYSNWKVEGNAFGNAPATGTFSSQNRISGFQGKALVNSFDNGNLSTGSLISPEFVIKKGAINFLIGGGNHRGRTCIVLEVAGQQVRVTEGNNNSRMTWKGWNVSGFTGKKGIIKIIDQHTGDWGHITVDQIYFADTVAHGEISGSVWLDAGRDNYAGVTWSDVPEEDGRRIFLGWMSNWAYAQEVPTTKWRSAMTIPWQLSVEHVDGIPRLIGNPVKDLEKLHSGEPLQLNQGVNNLLPDNGLAHILITLRKPDSGMAGFKISNQKDEYVEFRYHASSNQFFLDRTHSGDISFSGDFPGTSEVTRNSNTTDIHMEIYLDQSSIEIFLDGGKNIFTEIFFPSENFSIFEFLPGTIVKKATQYRLESIW